ncbi:MAG: PKD domain-containing protein [Candidatus Gracilibacteria bacterium]|nr:PKD domain-containing protein [Candidatus Gracilibacteria bacterium]MDD5178739.1 PKD domain-containing protein [Candidatus Gracilibacteria bacterium]
MPENKNLTGLDQVSSIIDKTAEATAVKPASNNPQPSKPSATSKIQPSKVAFGCGTLFIFLFVVLIAAMIFGLRAGSETIASFGLQPTTFKNWTIGIISVFFGLTALALVIALVFQFGKRLLATKSEVDVKKKATRKMLIISALFIVIMVIWVVIYSYISKFQMTASELPIEIVTNPTYTYSLTSPIQIDFSAERITSGFKSSHDLVSYEWDRDGDGVIDATGEKVTLYFPNGGKNNGVFDVKLLVRMQPKNGDPTIVKEYTKVVSISTQKIYGEIKADFESGEVPLTVKLSADSIADPQDSQITNYSWDLDGDGRADMDGVSYRKVSYTFDKIGEHKITLTVTSADLEADGKHEEKTFEKVITVYEPGDYDQSKLVLKATPQAGAAPLTVTFDASGNVSSGTSKIDSYEWLIGDGVAKLTGQRDKFTFTKPGTYPVTLRITYASGQVKSDIIEIKVNDTSYAPQAVITTSPAFSNRYQAVAGSAPFEVKFEATDSKDKDNNIVKYQWDFDGDNVWDAEGSNASYRYQTTGNYTVKLKITDADGNTSEATTKVLVGEELPVIDFGADKLSGPAPLAINFDASGSRLPNNRKIISYEWDFNAQETGNNKPENFIYQRAQTSHVFTETGEYLVKLILHADDGSTYYDTVKIIATHSSLSAAFTASRNSGKAPLAVSFDASSSLGEISSYNWVFNDGETSSVVNPTHIFKKTGSYATTLTIYDKLGNASQYTTTIKVE